MRREKPRRRLLGWKKNTVGSCACVFGSLWLFCSPASELLKCRLPATQNNNNRLAENRFFKLFSQTLSLRRNLRPPGGSHSTPWGNFSSQLDLVNVSFLFLPYSQFACSCKVFVKMWQGARWERSRVAGSHHLYLSDVVKTPTHSGDLICSQQQEKLQAV